jgi:polyhydroxybutyrate depolymerase
MRSPLRGSVSAQLAVGIALMLGVFLSGCVSQGTDSRGTDSRGTNAPPVASTDEIDTGVDTVAARPFELVVPKSYNAKSPAPLLIVLHGYTGDASTMRAYFDLDAAAEAKGILTVYADGTRDGSGQPFWNATDACCNFASSTVDDSAYLTKIIDQVSASHNVDPKRVYFAGHSNGGFMSFRMACEHADRIAAIVSLAGATYDDVAQCKPSAPVSVAQIHGTSDSTISYTGSAIFGHNFPGAERTVSTWAGYNKCEPTSKPTTKTLDLDTAIDGPETTVAKFANCATGAAVELWTINGGEHKPELGDAFGTNVIEFLLAHPKKR